MKIVKLCFVSAVVMAFFSGCTTYYRDTGVDSLERPASLGSNPYYTEYTIGQKRISAEGEASVLFWILQFAERKQCMSVRSASSGLANLSHLFNPTFKAILNAKNVAMYNACAQAQADQIMGATFDYIITDYLVFTTVKCVAKGFPAQVKGVKMVTKKPIILNKWQKIEYVAPHENPPMPASSTENTAPGSPERYTLLKFVDSVIKNIL